MTYEATPGSVAFRVLAHMELLHSGSEIGSALLAQATNCEAKALMMSLAPAIKARAIFVRQKGGHPKSPLFWSLVDHSTKTNGGPLPVAVVSQLSKPVREAIANGASVDDALSSKASTAAALQRIVNEMPRTGRARLSPGNGVDIDESHRRRDNVIEMDTPVRGSQHVLKAEGASPDATDRDAPASASPRVGAMGACQPADAGAAGDAPMLIALWSDGTLEIRRRGGDCVLKVEETRQLVAYLDSISLAGVREEGA